jgi:hypothetical protein
MDDECSHVLDMDKIIALEGEEEISNNPYEDDVDVVEGEEGEEEDNGL